MANRTLPLHPALSVAAAGNRGAASPRRVLLICPPFQHLMLSSLSTALLATVLREHGLDCEEAYVHFDLARVLGRERYHKVTDGLDGLVGELLFAEGLHGRIAHPEAEQRLAALIGSADERARLRAMLAERCLERVRAVAPDLIGLTTSLNQLLAALFLARVIKESTPGVRIVLGGSACSTPMGGPLIAAYPEVDFIVSGWGEPALLALAQGEEPASPVIESHAPIDLETVPVPDYRAFLRDAGEFANAREMAVAFESSRGCWWGAKHHCTFCGLNGVELAFTSKSSRRVVREVRELWGAYGKNLYATDTVLSIDHLRHAIPELGTFPEGPHLFYEVKANLTESDVIALRRARITHIQPGIESLSTALLGHLRKGIDAIRNVALLKWCREQGILAAWHQLVGIPGETPEDYAIQIALMKRIPHLTPPHSVNPIRIDRFSPYFEGYRGFGWERLEPLPEYRSLHPTLGTDDLAAVAYHFRGIGRTEIAECFRAAFEGAVVEWKRRHQRGDGLFLHPQHGLIRNDDGKTYKFQPHSGLEKVIEITHSVTTRARVVAQSGCAPKAIDQMAAAGILHVEGSKVINLVVRLPEDPQDFGHSGASAPSSSMASSSPT
ncbi:MAG: RiPP maturation radical SAM C-methyltransferase [Polyangiaceae bacterium]|nr:RiPP maturation radical SAM C-methyltransferase [Polyangiaceae bacterium]